MTSIEILRDRFSGFDFGAPCSAEDVARAELEIGEPLPFELVELYRAFDGFSGPTNAQFFWRLFDGSNGLVGFNRFLRAGEEFPRDFVSSCIFFGDAGIGSMWGIKRDLPGKIILWDAEWGVDFDVVGESTVQVWLEAKKFYDELP